MPQGGRTGAFAYVLDVVPTVLDIAGVKPGPNETALVAGRSMAELLTGKASLIHPESESIGYEAAGGAAVYRGVHKLVRSAPPYGDGTWRLYDLQADPTESKDLSAAQPDLAKSMIAAFADYAEKNGVVEVPSGYDVIEQAKKNAALTQ